MSHTPQHVKLSRLIAGMAELPEALDIEVTGISIDTRKISAGNLFIALPGTRQHGNHYIEAAVEMGATAIAYDADTSLSTAIDRRKLNDISLIKISDISQQAGIIASRYFNEPSTGMVVTGITGTNGKTTCSMLLAQSLNKLGQKASVIGTLGHGMLDNLQPVTHTTPDAVTLQRQIFELRESGTEQLLIEASSHGLQQGRLSGTCFAVALFTNLSQDHLDYHGSMQEYGSAKAKLFYHNNLKLAVINADDEFGRNLLSGPVRAGQIVSYGIENGDVQTSQIRMHDTGISIDVQSRWGNFHIDSHLLGRFNVYNLLASAAVLLATGYRADDIAVALSAAEPVAGRMECFNANGVTAVVDFAHSPDALQQALISLREHIPGKRLICVFGCGGERDQTKRPMMGEIAQRYSDVVILTDDNPRHEDPAKIRDDIVAGMAISVQQIPDRRQAINAAWQLAEPGDIILIAGKGHEVTQQLGDLKIPFDDREVVTTILSGLSDITEGQE